MEKEPVGKPVETKVPWYDRQKLKVRWYIFRIARIETKRQRKARSELKSKSIRRNLAVKQAAYSEYLRIETDKLKNRRGD